MLCIGQAGLAFVNSRPPVEKPTLKELLEPEVEQVLCATAAGDRERANYESNAMRKFRVKEHAADYFMKRVLHMDRGEA